MLDLYNLLPSFYHVEDAKRGEPLKKFLAPFQAVLDEIYADELALRLVQDPDFCREDFLKHIAESLGWQYISTATNHQRAEAKEIANFHDLKGTVYAMRLLSHICFGDLFRRLYEFYRGDPASISTIRADYESMDKWLRYLLEGNGTFAVPSWAEMKTAERGRPYGFDKNNRFYSYLVYNFVVPDDYVPGTVRPRYIKFIRNYLKWHPAGRFCYVYITCPIFRDEDETKADYLVDELVGVLHLDSWWEFDSGVYWDQGEGPVHPSISYIKVREFKTLDDGREFDMTPPWHWDEMESAVHILIELD